MASIEMVKTTKKYGAVTGVDAVDLTIADGEFVVLLGPSGCGKSTLLRMVAGLEEISSGEIRFDGVAVNDVTTQKRNVAMVFQNYALYPHMSVKENMSFGLRINGRPGKSDRGKSPKGRKDPRDFRLLVTQAQTTVRRTAAACRYGAIDRSRACRIPV